MADEKNDESARDDVEPAGEEAPRRGARSAELGGFFFAPADAADEIADKFHLQIVAAETLLVDPLPRQRETEFFQQADLFAEIIAPRRVEPDEVSGGFSFEILVFEVLHFLFRKGRKRRLRFAAEREQQFFLLDVTDDALRLFFAGSAVGKRSERPPQNEIVYLRNDAVYPVINVQNRLCIVLHKNTAFYSVFSPFSGKYTSIISAQKSRINVL